MASKHMRNNGQVAANVDNDIFDIDDEVTYVTGGSPSSDRSGGYMQHRPGRRRRRVKRRHKRTGCIVAGVLLCILLVLAGIGGFMGLQLYRSARTVQGEAQTLMGQVDGVSKAIKEGDSSALQNAAGSVSTSAHAIKDEINSPLWRLAAKLPVVGSDVQSVHALADVAVDLADNALVPISSNSGIMDLKNIFVDGGINVGVIQGLADALDEAAPAFSRSADALNALPEAKIDRVGNVLVKARTAIVEANGMVQAAQSVLPYLPAMVGANGQTRNYLVIAQNNSESRSTGGLPNPAGVLSVTDGHLEMGEFLTFGGNDYGQVEAREDELTFWATNFSTNPAQLTFLADFARVGELARDFWSQHEDQIVDGVIAVDPVFLQHMIALTGRVDIDDGYGSWIDGTDTASTLLNKVYIDMFPGDYAAQDQFFRDTAASAFESIVTNIGNVGAMDLAKQLADDVEHHRIYAWMANPDEQALMERFGAAGRVGNDPTKPEVGIYLNDSTWSKICWYARFDVEVGNGVQNTDGTTTYPVHVGFTNTMTPEEGETLPKYITGYNDEEKRTRADMISRFFVLGPAGGSLSNVACETGESVVPGTCYGVDGFFSYMHTDALETDAFTFDVTVPAEATQPLKVRTTPLGQEENINISYAWESK